MQTVSTVFYWTATYWQTLYGLFSLSTLVPKSFAPQNNFP